MKKSATKPSIVNYSGFFNPLILTEMSKFDRFICLMNQANIDLISLFKMKELPRAGE